MSLYNLSTVECRSWSVHRCQPWHAGQCHQTHLVPPGNFSSTVSLASVSTPRWRHMGVRKVSGCMVITPIRSGPAPVRLARYLPPSLIPDIYSLRTETEIFPGYRQARKRRVPILLNRYSGVGPRFLLLMPLAATLAMVIASRLVISLIGRLALLLELARRRVACPRRVG